jgi:putative NIF3 family GTP cyclohydrolase 1 type 2
LVLIIQMELSIITKNLDNLFGVKRLNTDPAMSRWVPRVYDVINFNWKSTFESDFCQRFNGLMIRGAVDVSKIFCSVFPTKEVLMKFIKGARKGDLLFLHHPIDMQCGDPRNQKKLGAGFMAIDPEIIDEILMNSLSVYSCHAPMDCNENIGTNTAIVSSLNATIISEFLPYGNGFAGRICKIKTVSTKELVSKLMSIFEIPYVDFAGKEINKINKIAVVAGGGDDVEVMEEIENKGVQAYITGEIHSYHSSDWAKQNTIKVNSYSDKTNMSMIGVSHASSEYLVMKNQMVPWFETALNIKSEGIPLSTWWR